MVKFNVDEENLIQEHYNRCKEWDDCPKSIEKIKFTKTFDELNKYISSHLIYFLIRNDNKMSIINFIDLQKMCSSDIYESIMYNPSLLCNSKFKNLKLDEIDSFNLVMNKPDLIGFEVVNFNELNGDYIFEILKKHVFLIDNPKIDVSKITEKQSRELINLYPNLIHNTKI